MSVGLQTLSVSDEEKVALVSDSGWAMRDASTAPPAAPWNAQFSSMPHGPRQSNANIMPSTPWRAKLTGECNGKRDAHAIIDCQQRQ